MPARALEGKPIADVIEAEVKERATHFTRRRGRPPGLAVVLVGDDPASHVYVGKKEQAARSAGVAGRSIRLPSTATQVDVLAAVDVLNADEAVDGILVQL